MGLLRGSVGVAMLLAVCIGTQAADAHHSSAVYDMDQRIHVTGTVTKVMWVNPHAYFELQGKAGNGPVVQWEFLLNSPNEMMRSGSRRDSVKAGDAVQVEAYPGRGNPNRAFAIYVILPNGQKVLQTQ